ncbi:MAG: hypothetical protein K2K97_02330, partial [Muribaculaceae bacterium]|nr:hypothetical protein [Muribaculaceae bacterium]
ALAIMQAVDTAGLSRPRLARYALLLTKAQTKNNVRLGNDSIIGIAYDYYVNKGDSMDMMASCYYGEIQFYYMRKYGEALVCLRRAFDLANNLNFPFYAALCARNISNIYAWLYKSDDELKWARISKDKFMEAGTDRHAKWGDILIANSLISIGDVEEAKEIINNVDSVEYMTDKRYRYEILKIKADIANSEGKYGEAAAILSGLKADGFKFKSHTWCKLSDNYFESGQLPQASEALDSARLCVRTDQEKLYCNYLDALILNHNGQVRDAFRKAIEWGEGIEKEADSQLNEPATGLLDEYLSKEIETEKISNRLMRNRILLISIISGLLVLIAIMGIVLLMQNIKRKKQEVIYLTSQIESLNTDFYRLKELLENRDLEKEEVCDSIDSIEETGSIINQCKDTEFARDYFKGIEIIYEKSYLYLETGASKRLPSDIEKLLNYMRSEENINKLDRFIDSLSNGYMLNFIQDFPGLKNYEYRLARYLFVKFSSNTIALLLDKGNAANVYNIKSRLKKKLKEINPKKFDEYSATLF